MTDFPFPGLVTLSGQNNNENTTESESESEVEVINSFVFDQTLSEIEFR